MKLYYKDEIWKDYFYNGLDYKISNYGRVFGVSSGRILKTRLNPDGYITATFGKGEIGRTSMTVHRLVAKLFVDNPNEYNEVNHIDFDRTNNKYDNLEWVTHEMNIKYTVLANRHSTSNGNYNGENNPNWNNHILSEIYKNNPELAKEKCSRPKEQNGRATPIILYDINKNKIKIFKYIGECAEYLVENNITKAEVNSIRANITNSIKKNKPYLRHYFKRVI